MSFRITDGMTQARLASQINANRERIALNQERLGSGKRINRPSDDPAGADAVLRIRTSQSILEKFQSAAASARDRLLVADGALDSYQTVLDRARGLLTQGASGTTDASTRAAIAQEFDGLRSQILSITNMHNGDDYVFGGTRQNAPPFDPTTQAPAAIPSSPALVQLEPDGAPVTIGLAAESVFSDATGTIFQTLADVTAALRGTGDETTDNAAMRAGLDRLGAFNELAQLARTRVGIGMNAADAAAARLGRDSLNFADTAQRIEGADFVSTALDLTNSQRALDATLQSSSYAGRRTLIDFLG